MLVDIVGYSKGETHILTMNGESYRFKQSMSRKKKTMILFSTRWVPFTCPPGSLLLDRVQFP